MTAVDSQVQLGIYLAAFGLAGLAICVLAGVWALVERGWRAFVVWQTAWTATRPTARLGPPVDDVELPSFARPLRPGQVPTGQCVSCYDRRLLGDLEYVRGLGYVCRGGCGSGRAA